MKINIFKKLVSVVSLLFVISFPAHSGPGGGGSGGPGIIPPGGGQEMRFIEGSEVYTVNFFNPNMPAVNLDDYLSERFEVHTRFTDEQFEMIYELMESGALDKLEFHFRDGSSLMLGH